MKIDHKELINENRLAEKLPQNMEATVVLGSDDILSSKLEKYCKRVLGKVITLSFDKAFLSSMSSLRSFFSFVSPAVVIIVFIDKSELEKKKQIIKTLAELNIKVVVIGFEEYLNLLYSDQDDSSKMIIIEVSSMYGFNELRGELELLTVLKRKFVEVHKWSSGKLELADIVASNLSARIKNVIDGSPELIGGFDYPTKPVIGDVKIALQQSRCSLRLLYKGLPHDNQLGVNVAEFRIKLGEELANHIDEDIINRIDYVVPVPSSGNFYAVGLSKKICKPFLPALRKPDVSERAFEIQDVDMRKSYLSKNMQVNKSLVKGKKLLIVDEAIFTGATLKVVCESLIQAGAEEIHIAIPSPHCNFSCPYLVQPKRTLLLHKINVHAVNRYFDATSVSHISFEAYERAMNAVSSLCTECFHPEIGAQ